jgi:hypothetical protein
MITRIKLKNLEVVFLAFNRPPVLIQVVTLEKVFLDVINAP